MTTPEDRATPATPEDGATPATPDDETPTTTTPVWWTAVPVLVGAYAVWGLLSGPTGAIWPWGDLVVLAVALALLGFVLAPRLKERRRR